MIAIQCMLNIPVYSKICPLEFSDNHKIKCNEADKP